MRKPRRTYTPPWSEFTAGCIVLCYGVKFYRAGYDVCIVLPSPWPLDQHAIEYLIEHAIGQKPQENAKQGVGRYYSLPRSFFIMSEHEWRTLTVAPFEESHKAGMNKIIATPVSNSASPL